MMQRMMTMLGQNIDSQINLSLLLFLSSYFVSKQFPQILRWYESDSKPQAVKKLKYTWLREENTSNKPCITQP